MLHALVPLALRFVQTMQPLRVFLPGSGRGGADPARCGVTVPVVHGQDFIEDIPAIIGHGQLEVDDKVSGTVN